MMSAESGRLPPAIVFYTYCASGQCKPHKDEETIATTDTLTQALAKGAVVEQLAMKV
jgi:hypothetical protein